MSATFAAVQSARHKSSAESPCLGERRSFICCGEIPSGPAADQDGKLFTAARTSSGVMGSKTVVIGSSGKGDDEGTTCFDCNALIVSVENRATPSSDNNNLSTALTLPSCSLALPLRARVSPGRDVDGLFFFTTDGVAPVHPALKSASGFLTRVAEETVSF